MSEKAAGDMEGCYRDRRPDALGDLRVLPDELICSILDFLSLRDVARLSCVSSVMYIFCNEEPLWMNLCLANAEGLLEYRGSWKKTAIHHLRLSNEVSESCRKPLTFDGFNSLFLYRRWYRCFTMLNDFSIDRGVDRRKDLSIEEFYAHYDGQIPVLLTELVNNWPAKSKWTTDYLLQNYGETSFRLSQRSAKKIVMKFKDYISYMKSQHDEDPLYIFDEKFVEVAPGLLKDYAVPHLFEEDLFDVLDISERPSFRWLIIGPERSGASWHVDPALTSAWNTLLVGRKRWALYPPGKVPVGVTVNVSEEDGDINIECPSSLQWWLDIYPLLADEDKPLECTQLPGETIFVPSGWWHCVLNLETSIAVTQNFVNTKNFGFVCLDMAPGYRHKGVCRAGMIAIQENSFGTSKIGPSCVTEQFNDLDTGRREKRLKVTSRHEHRDNGPDSIVGNGKFYQNGNDKVVSNGEGESQPHGLKSQEYSYTVDFLSMFLEAHRDHYNSIWSPSNCIGQREFREWLLKLWVLKPGMKEMIWKGACISLDADKWLERAMKICASHNLLSSSLENEKLPVSTGSNPVYFAGEHVIKIYVEGGLEASVNSLGTELEFYSLLCKVKSPLREHIPKVLASGILFYESGSYGTVSWDGKGVPDIIAKSNLISGDSVADDFSFGIRNKKRFELNTAEWKKPQNGVVSSSCTKIWPYMITKRCDGDIFAHIRDRLSWNDILNLASFLGDQVRCLHLLPLPSFPNSYHPLSLEDAENIGKNKACVNDEELGSKVPLENNFQAVNESFIPLQWELFVEIMKRRQKNVLTRLAKWGDIPNTLLEKVEEYLPHDVSLLISKYKDNEGRTAGCKAPTWIHSDIMDDNIQMEPSSSSQFSDTMDSDARLVGNNLMEVDTGDIEVRKWHPSYVLDFSDLSIGDPLCDLIPIHLDVFRGDVNLLRCFLQSYKLPFIYRSEANLTSNSQEDNKRIGRTSYHIMCYCILHEDNVLGAIFNLWKDLRKATSWEEVEERVWGTLNDYQGFFDN
ncbi:F-box protein At1g78280 [Amborella trichopoda]|uniref:JmjC domain-containing protein n=1 Tax=Amborella trichopoda TaxID=13333 RepID=U5CXQ1_AMBTC|nr:F-box protein At1g78280 [Amborella trichopoda]ERN14745.1 hypothetical protein AMTR_s00038p00238560 [Amborella trichopoda]|eukprot:XP_006853278.1 F-box protein At1g78280 [Amborella trichopoda]